MKDLWAEGATIEQSCERMISLLDVVMSTGYTQVLRRIGSSLEVVASRIDPSKASYRFVNIRRPMGVIARAFADRKVVYLDDLSPQSKGYVPAEISTRSELAIPIVRPAGEGWGVVNLESTQPKFFSEKEREWLGGVVHSFGLLKSESESTLPPYFVANLVKFLAGEGIEVPNDDAAINPDSASWHALWQTSGTEPELCALATRVIAACASSEEAPKSVTAEIWAADSRGMERVTVSTSELDLTSFAADVENMEHASFEPRILESGGKRIFGIPISVGRTGIRRNWGALLILTSLEVDFNWSREWAEKFVSSFSVVLESFESIFAYRNEKASLHDIREWLSGTGEIPRSARAAICARVAQRALPFLALANDCPSSPARSWVHYCEEVARGAEATFDEVAIQGAVAHYFPGDLASPSSLLAEAACARATIALAAQAALCSSPAPTLKNLRDFHAMLWLVVNWGVEASLVESSSAPEFVKAFRADLERARAFKLRARSSLEPFGKLWGTSTAVWRKNANSPLPPGPTWRIMVTGTSISRGGDETRLDKRNVYRQIAETMVRLGYGYVSNQRTGTESEVHLAYVSAMERRRELLDAYVLTNQAPSRQAQRFHLDDHAVERLKGIIDQIDAVIVLSGYEGTRRIVDMASKAGIPVFPIASTGGLAKLRFASADPQTTGGWTQEQIQVLGEDIPTAIDLLFRILPRGLKKRSVLKEPREPVRLVREFRGNTEEVLRINWSPDGSQIATCTVDKKIQIWRIASQEMVLQLEGHSQGVNSAVWSPDGKWLASCSYDRTIRIWSTSDWSEQFMLTGHDDDISDVIWSPTGRLLASASADTTIRTWSFKARKLGSILRGHTDAVMRLRLGLEGDLLSCSRDGTLRRWKKWNSSSSTLVAPRLAPGISGFTRVRGGRGFTLASFDSKIYVSGDPQDDLRPYPFHRAMVRSVSASFDGRFLASNGGPGDDRVCIWDARTMAILHSFKEPASGYFPCSIAWSPTEYMLATLGESDRIVRVWNISPDLLTPKTTHSTSRPPQRPLPKKIRPAKKKK